MTIKLPKTISDAMLYKPSLEVGSSSVPYILLQQKVDPEEVIMRYAQRYDLIFSGFHVLYGKPIYSWKDFLRFMKENMGLGVTVMHFENLTDNTIAGTWYWDCVEKKSFTIRLNPFARDANITIGHECVHAIQDIDPDFKQELQSYPIPLQMRIADRVAEMVAIQIFRPREKVACDKLAGLSIYEIALKYGVSEEIADSV